MKLPLENVNILDLTHALAGPFCSTMLADYGANVIKLEAFGTGDIARSWGAPLPGGETAYFAALHRNKKGIELNLKHAHGKELFFEFVKRCDIVVQVGTETFGAKGGMAESEKHHGWASWVVGSAEQQARIPKRPVSNLDFVNYPDLCDVLRDPDKRRAKPEQVTFFHNLGLLGFQFAAVAAKAYNLAIEKGIGLKMSTDPFLQDIRD